MSSVVRRGPSPTMRSHSPFAIPSVAAGRAHSGWRSSNGLSPDVLHSLKSLALYDDPRAGATGRRSGLPDQTALRPHTPGGVAAHKSPLKNPFATGGTRPVWAPPGMHWRPKTPESKLLGSRPGSRGSIAASHAGGNRRPGSRGPFGSIGGGGSSGGGGLPSHQQEVRHCARVSVCGRVPVRMHCVCNGPMHSPSPPPPTGGLGGRAPGHMPTV